MSGTGTSGNGRPVVAGRVSAIIPVFNRARFLDEAVRSHLDQDHVEKELILVDDGSTDDTSEHVRAWTARAPDQIRSLRIENRGPGGAREAGRQLATGEFLQYLDSDDRLLPGKYRTQVDALRGRPDAGVAYGRTRLIDSRGTVLRAPFKRSGERLDALFPALLVDRWWNTHTPLYRRSVTDRIGAWTCMRMGEDWEYDARVGALRTPLVFCDAWVSEHRAHDGERLTGGELSEEALLDTGQLVVALSDAARTLGLDVRLAEMAHFSRWAFHLARQLALAGHEEASRACLEVAMRSDRSGGRGVEFVVFRVLSTVLGLRAGTRLLEAARSLRGVAPGARTLRQSWDDDE